MRRCWSRRRAAVAGGRAAARLAAAARRREVAGRAGHGAPGGERRAAARRAGARDARLSAASAGPAERSERARARRREAADALRAGHARPARGPQADARRSSSRSGKNATLHAGGAGADHAFVVPESSRADPGRGLRRDGRCGRAASPLRWRRLTEGERCVPESARSASRAPRCSARERGGGAPGPRARRRLQHWLHYSSDPLHVAPLALVAFTLALVWRHGAERARARARARTR